MRSLLSPTAPMALVAIALALGRPAAQAPESDPPAFSPRGVCAGTSTVRWHTLAPRTDRELLDRWCDSVGPPFVAPRGAPSASMRTLVIATWNVHAGNGDVEAFLASVARIPEAREP